VKGIVDRFEGNYVVIEIDGATQDILKSEVDEQVQVGDSVSFINGTWKTDKGDTQSREHKIKKLMGDVWEN
jgi:hypothetical protein